MVAFLSALGSHLGFLPFVWSMVLPKMPSNLTLYNDSLFLGWSKYVLSIYLKKTQIILTFAIKQKLHL